eukprot:scaffold81997_cov51-Phaeocystis_antarctica.AAC.1
MLRLSLRTRECLHLFPFQGQEQPLAGEPRGLHACKSHHDRRAAIAAAYHATLAATCTTSIYGHRPMRVGPDHQLRVLLQLRSGGCVRRDQHYQPPIQQQRVMQGDVRTARAAAGLSLRHRIGFR